MAKSNKEESVLWFTKKQIVNSKKYARYVDFLNGNLRGNEMYTLEQVDKLITDYYGKGKSVR